MYLYFYLIWWLFFKIKTYNFIKLHVTRDLKKVYKKRYIFINNLTNFWGVNFCMNWINLIRVRRKNVPCLCPMRNECMSSNHLNQFKRSEFNELEPRLKPVSNERRLKSWNIEYNFKWNQPNLSRGPNFLSSASDIIIH